MFIRRTTFFLLIVTVCGLLTNCTSTSPPKKIKNTLACRYRTNDGHLVEKTGLSQTGQEITYPLERSGKKFLWSCSGSQCPLFLKNKLTYLPANLRFVVNDSENFGLRKSFENEAIQSCEKYTPHENTHFVEYGIKSTTDAQSTFFHKPFFERVQTNDVTPFGRIVAFGDSLSDNGNAFANSTRVLKWPYFIGRFSNGPIWIENIATKLSKQQEIPIDLYNYAQGSENAEYIEFTPYALDSQVDTYLSSMDNTCPTNSWGCRDNKWDPAYDKTLFVMLPGANDYMYCASLTSTKRKRKCHCESANDCANIVINGLTKNSLKLSGLKNKILDIIEHARETSDQDAQYFLIPNLPDLSLLPYYKKGLAKDNAQVKFAHQASIAHNTLLTEAIIEIQMKHPNIKIIKLNLYRFIENATRNPSYGPIYKSRLTNTTNRCFLGTPVNGSVQFCNDPASYLFWDYMHPSMTAQCVIAEYAIAEIHSIFFKNSSYSPNYAACHNSYIKH